MFLSATPSEQAYRRDVVIAVYDGPWKPNTGYEISDVAPWAPENGRWWDDHRAQLLEWLDSLAAKDEAIWAQFLIHLDQKHGWNLRIFQPLSPFAACWLQYFHIFYGEGHARLFSPSPRGCELMFAKLAPDTWESWPVGTDIIVAFPLDGSGPPRIVSITLPQH